MEKLNSNLLLLYTGIQRNADAIAKNYVHKLSNEKEKNVRKIISNVELGEKMIKSGNINDFGKLLHHAWIEKKELSKSISNYKIDELYKASIQNGALGGKLLGAGASGFILLYADKKFHSSIRSVLGLREVKFNLDQEGSQIIYSNN